MHIITIYKEDIKNMQKKQCISSIYNYKISPINYTNDDEYRRCFQNVFFSNINNNDIYEKDNDIYEKDKVDYAMEYLFDLTKDDPLFCNLYELAAAKMISTEKEIGQCILFSYDYFDLFHSCLSCFIQEKEEIPNLEKIAIWNGENPSYKTLLYKVFPLSQK